MSIRQVRQVPTEDRLGKVSNDLISVDVAFSGIDTSALDAADLIADLVEVPGATLGGGRYCELVSIIIHDEDDQGAALWAVFATASTTFGTSDSAPSISDANARNIVGAVGFATTDYVDCGGSKVGFKNAVGAVMKSAAASSSLYVALVNGAGTPTYTAAGIRATLTFRRH